MRRRNITIFWETFFFLHLSNRLLVRTVNKRLNQVDRQKKKKKKKFERLC